jgi:hypothetical protein
VHTLFESFLPTASLPPQFQAGPVLPLSLILLKKRHKPNKEDNAFEDILEAESQLPLLPAVLYWAN